MTTRSEPAFFRPALDAGYHIAVGVDGTDQGWAALEWACEEAEPTDATLTICSPRPPHGPVRHVTDMASMELIDPVLARHVHRARDRLGGHRVDIELPARDPARALLDSAGRADLLVLGAGTPLDRTSRSTIATHVAAKTATPLVVVRPTLPDPEGRLFAGHVVVGVDGTADSRAAIQFAFRYAHQHRVPLAAVHVATAPPDDFWFDESMLETHVGTEPAPMALLAAELEPAVTRYRDVPVKRVVCPGRPVQALRRAASGAYLLVLGRGGSRIAPLPRFGSVTHAFALDAACVVAIVPGRPAVG
jgi:nucleotide-binding universal stress UspA family protein